MNSALRVELDEQDLRCRGAALKWLQARGVVIVRLVSANVDHILGSLPREAKTPLAVGECVCGLPSVTPFLVLCGVRSNCRITPTERAKDSFVQWRVASLATL